MSSSIYIIQNGDVFVFHSEKVFDKMEFLHKGPSNDGFVTFHYRSYGTLFFYNKIGSIIPMVVLPTTEIIEPVFFTIRDFQSVSLRKVWDK